MDRGTGRTIEIARFVGAIGARGDSLMLACDRALPRTNVDSSAAMSAAGPNRACDAGFPASC